MNLEKTSKAKFHWCMNELKTNMRKIGKIPTYLGEAQ
jgi:hypothetical protein